MFKYFCRCRCGVDALCLFAFISLNEYQLPRILTPLCIQLTFYPVSFVTTYEPVQTRHFQFFLRSTLTPLSNFRNFIHSHRINAQEIATTASFVNSVWVRSLKLYRCYYFSASIFVGFTVNVIDDKPAFMDRLPPMHDKRRLYENFNVFMPV